MLLGLKPPNPGRGPLYSVTWPKYSQALARRLSAGLQVSWHKVVTPARLSHMAYYNGTKSRNKWWKVLTRCALVVMDKAPAPFFLLVISNNKPVA